MKKLRWLIIPVMVVLVGALWFEPTHSLRGWARREPFYQNRSASWWEASLLKGDPVMIAHWPERLESGKSEGVPVLIHLLGSPRPEVRWNAADVLGKIGEPAAESVTELVRLLDDRDPFVRRSAIQALAAIKPDRPDVVAAIVARLPTDDRDYVIRPLSRFGGAARAAVPLLTDMARDQTLPVKTRWEAGRTLGKIGPDAKSAVPTLIELLSDKENPIREHAAESLGEIGAAEAVGPLTKALADPATKVRRDAVRSLGQLGPLAKGSLPAIEKLQEDKEEMVREAAKTALRRIDPERK